MRRVVLVVGSSKGGGLWVGLGVGEKRAKAGMREGKTCMMERKGKNRTSARWLDCDGLYDYDGLYHICGNTERRDWREDGIDGISMNHLFTTVQLLQNG